MPAVRAPSDTAPACTPADTLRTAAEYMTTYETSTLAVRAGRRTVAEITDRELVRAIADGADPTATRVHEYAVPLPEGVRLAHLSSPSQDAAQSTKPAARCHCPADDERDHLGDAAWWLEGLDGNWRY